MLAMAIKEADANAEKKISPLEQRVEGLNASIKATERSQEELNTRLNRQEALNRVQNPEHILAIIRAGIQGFSGSSNPQLIPASALQDYKRAIRALPQSSARYWETVATIINYQSLLNQIRGNAPDPAVVARPCSVTAGGGATSNIYDGLTISNCVVDLGTNLFRSVTFKNSVVRYRGGASGLSNVTFENCRFLLDIPKMQNNQPDEKLLFALLDSPDQKSVHL